MTRLLLACTLFAAVQVDASAAFRVVAPTDAESLEIHASDGTILCTRDAGFADLWIRLGTDPRGRGDAGAHLDLDICRLANGGEFAPMDPRGARCADRPTWGVWWHTADGAVYANASEADGCALVLELDGDALTGSFRCPGLRAMDGEGEVDLLDGTLRCTIR